MHVSAWQRYLVQVGLWLLRYWSPCITNLYLQVFSYKSFETLQFFWYNTCLEKLVSRRFSRCFSSRDAWQRQVFLLVERSWERQVFIFNGFLARFSGNSTNLWISISGAWINKSALSTPLMILDLSGPLLTSKRVSSKRALERWLVSAMTYV